MLNAIFTPGWEFNLLLFTAIFFLADYIVYKIIYPAIVGPPNYESFRSMHQWYRKASWWSSVVFAPLYEEFLFTFLAFTTFLRYAQHGQEGIVMILVAAFFSLLHFPGDLEKMRSRLSPARIFLLFKYQLDRFFYALAAYIIFENTGYLWITIIIHYFFNFVLTICIFEREDHPEVASGRDGRLLMLSLLDLAFAVMSTAYFYFYFPGTWPVLLSLTIILLLHFLSISFRMSR